MKSNAGTPTSHRTQPVASSLRVEHVNLLNAAADPWSPGLAALENYLGKQGFEIWSKREILFEHDRRWKDKAPFLGECRVFEFHGNVRKDAPNAKNVETRSGVVYLRKWDGSFYGTGGDKSMDTFLERQAIRLRTAEDVQQFAHAFFESPFGGTTASQIKKGEWEIMIPLSGRVYYQRLKLNEHQFLVECQSLTRDERRALRR